MRISIIQKFVVVMLAMVGGMQSLSAQIILANDGAQVRIEPGLVVSVQGGIINNNGGEFFNSGQVFVADSVENNVPNGMFNNTLFAPGTVILNNTLGPSLAPIQLIRGTQPIYFQNLTLDGTNIKALDNSDAWVRNTLDIDDREFDLRLRVLHVANPAVNAILRNGGFFSSDDAGLASGYLLRYTNSTGNYVFPMGDQLLTQNQRTAYVTPTSAVADSFQLRLAPYNATLDGFSTAVFNPATICSVNPAYYHRLQRLSAQTANIGLTLFYDPANDPAFGGLAGFLQTPPWWDSISNATSPLTEPGLQNFTANNLNINTFADEAFAFMLPQPSVTATGLLANYCQGQPNANVVGAPLNPTGSTYLIYDITSGVLPGTLVYQGPSPVVPVSTLPVGTYLSGYFIAATGVLPYICNSDTAFQQFVIQPVPTIIGDNLVCAETQNEIYTHVPSTVAGVWSISSTNGSTIDPATGVVDFGPNLGPNAVSVQISFSVSGSTCSATYPVSVDPTPQFVSTNLTDFCGGESNVVFSVSGNPTPYVWGILSSIGSVVTGPASSVFNFGNPSASAAQDTVVVTIQNPSGNNCSDRWLVTVHPLPDVSIVPQGGATAVCANSSLLLAGLPAGATTYAWSAVDAGLNPVPAGTFTPNATSQNTTFNAEAADLPAGNYAVSLLVSQEIVVPSGPNLTCFNSSLTNILVNPAPEIASLVPNPSPVCVGGDVTWTATAAGGAGLSYAWNGGAASASNQFTVTNVAAAPNPLPVSVVVANAANCTANATASVPVLPTPVASIVLPAVNPLCAGATYTATANPPSGPGSSFEYDWAFNGIPIGTFNGVNTIDFTAADGPLAVTITNTVSGCQGAATLAVSALEEPQFALTSSNPNNLVCAGDTIVFNVSLLGGGNPSLFTYNWSLTEAGGAMTPITGTPTTTGSQAVATSGVAISVLVQSLTCPNFDFTDNLPAINYTVIDTPTVSFTYLPDTPFVNQPVSFTASYLLVGGAPITDATYLWDMVGNDNPEVIAPDEVTTYQFATGGPHFVTLTFVQMPGGCTATYSDSVFVRPAVDIFVPTAFTPGVPGPNANLDIWAPGIDPSTFSMTFYDRWGNEIRTLSGNILNKPNSGWDGTNDSGDKLPEGVYVWKINAQSLPDVQGRRQGFQKAGSVTLLW